jgi:hypothetical protein
MMTASDKARLAGVHPDLVAVVAAARPHFELNRDAYPAGSS